MSMRRGPLILAALAGLFVLSVNDVWAPKTDSALYVGLGRSLAEGRGMVFKGTPYRGVPPLVPMLVAGCRWLAGEGFWLPNLLMRAFGLGVVALWYLALGRLAEDWPATARGTLVLGSLLVAGTSARLYVDSTLIMTDVPGLFWAVAAVVAFQRAERGGGAWLLAGAAAVALGLLTRLPGAACYGGLVAAAGMGAWRSGRRRRALALLGAGLLAAAVVVGLWAVLVRSRAGPASADYLRALGEGGWSLFSPRRWPEWVAGLARLPDAVGSAIVYQKLGWFGLAPLALMAIGLVEAVRRRQWLVVVPTVLYTASLVFWTPGAVASRYMLLVMPMLAYLMVGGAAAVAAWGGRATATAAGAHPRGRRGAASPSSETPEAAPAARPAARAIRTAAVWLPAVVVGASLVVSLPKVARQVYWMRHPDFYAVYEDGDWADYRALADHLRRRGDPAADRCLVPEAGVVHLWSGLVCQSVTAVDGRAVVVSDLEPEGLIRAAVEGGFRFVAVEADKGTWSRETLDGLTRTGLFADGPRRFGRLLLFERVGQAGAPFRDRAAAPRMGAGPGSAGARR